MYGSTCGGKTKNAADSQRFNLLERDTELVVKQARIAVDQNMHRYVKI